MTESPYLALIHAEIDGELDEHQRADLARHLLDDPRSRALRDGLKEVCAALDGIAAVEPPQELRSSILAALPPMSARPMPARRAARWSVPATGWRYAALFAGALISVALLYQGRIGHGPNANEVAGTMAGSAAHSPVALDTARVDLGQVTGQVSLYRAGAGLGLELQLVASAPVDVLVVSGGQTQRISGLGRPDSPGGPRTTVALPDFSGGAQTVDLSFLVAGRPIGSTQLKVPAAH
jgi:anti-sigma-K factor RskA